MINATLTDATSLIRPFHAEACCECGAWKPETFTRWNGSGERGDWYQETVTRCCKGFTYEIRYFIGRRK